MNRAVIWSAPVLLGLAAAIGCAGPARAASPPIVAWVYTVRHGDTLASIAARMGVSAADLARANGLAETQRVVTGTTLNRPDPVTVPHSRPHVGAAQSPNGANRGGASVQGSRAPAAKPPSLKSRTPRLIWPTSGAVIGQFGSAFKGRVGNGINLAAFTGMNVRAAAGGRVIFAGTEHERFGQLVIIDHGNGWATAYAYLGKVMVREGSMVRTGAVIARIGASGEARKPTLHFELRHDNVPYDPLPVLPLRL